jgi:hypothetical protein
MREQAKKRDKYDSLSIATTDDAWVRPGAAFHGPWLGGFQPAGSLEPDGGWQWVTGETWSFTNWTVGEPNNTSGREAFLHFFGRSDDGRSSTWNDLRDDFGITAFVVEYIPAPSSSIALVLTALATRRQR